MGEIDDDQKGDFHSGDEVERRYTGRTILLMDDEESILEAFGDLLAMRGFEVLTARNGIEAISLYRAAMEDHKPVDVVILDLIVPGGMGGIETMKRLKEMDPRVCALISSGLPQEAVDEYASSGFAGTMPKPYRWRDLIFAINDALHRK